MTLNMQLVSPTFANMTTLLSILPTCSKRKLGFVLKNIVPLARQVQHSSLLAKCNATLPDILSGREHRMLVLSDVYASTSVIITAYGGVIVIDERGNGITLQADYVDAMYDCGKLFLYDTMGRMYNYPEYNQREPVLIAENRSFATEHRHLLKAYFFKDANRLELLYLHSYLLPQTRTKRVHVQLKLDEEMMALLVYASDEVVLMLSNQGRLYKMQDQRVKHLSLKWPIVAMKRHSDPRTVQVLYDNGRIGLYTYTYELTPSARLAKWIGL